VFALLEFDHLLVYTEQESLMRSLRTAALALAMGLLAGVPVFAARAKSAPSDPAAAQIVTELRQVVHLLNEANHDYEGHRAEAVHLVHKAIHALHPHHKHKATTKPVVKAPAAKEDQAKSDAQLKAAIQALQTVLTQLSSSNIAHHQKAAADVQAAINELNKALAIK
jgi:hypothetical protein